MFCFSDAQGLSISAGGPQEGVSHPKPRGIGGDSAPQDPIYAAVSFVFPTPLYLTPFARPLHRMVHEMMLRKFVRWGDPSTADVGGIVHFSITLASSYSD